MVISLLIVIALLLLIIFVISNVMTKRIKSITAENERIIEAHDTLKDTAMREQEANQVKSRFLATMSHEIRTPMNAILGITEIQLQAGTLPPNIKDAFIKIYESGDLLLNIINEILDLSKIEAGRLELVPVKYDIPSLINDTSQLNRLRYDNKPILFTLQVDENTPIDLFGDELRIKQILNNILSNAFKYTDKGSVDFFVSAQGGALGNAQGGTQGGTDLQDGDDVTLVFRISDTGQGMTEAEINKLFEEYTRFNTDVNRTSIGAGLGMTITKRLIDLMNGTILVESEPDKGSVFTVHLPQKCAGAELCGAEIAGKLQKFNFQSTTIMKKAHFSREYMPYGSVLVVDDVESNIYVAKGMLLPYELQIETASSGFEAIEKIKNGNVYDIIFMDHMMPKMDGIETTKVLRDMGYSHNIIALTANALVGQAKIFLKNGFDGFISKPIDSRELNHILNEFIRNRKPPEVVEAARRKLLEKRLKTIDTIEDNTELSIDEIILERNEMPVNDSAIKRFFIYDAENAIKTLENLALGDEDLAQFTTAVHGIKSALANIDEKELSDVAGKLEKAGREKNYMVITNETPAFVNALKSLVTKLKPETGLEDDIQENPEYLTEKLLEIKTACEAFDKKTAKKAINSLREKKWPDNINKTLDEISRHLLHSDFNEAITLTEKIM